MTCDSMLSAIKVSVAVLLFIAEIGAFGQNQSHKLTEHEEERFAKRLMCLLATGSCATFIDNTQQTPE